MRPFHVMAKPIGATCNLKCRYCYYLPKEQLLGQRRGGRMSPAVLENYIRQYIASQPGNDITFAWQGGEPTLLGLDFFHQVLALQARYRQPHQRIFNDLQTNGLLLDDAWCRFLKENGFLVGISIDGPQALHDACRLDRRGRPTFDQVLAGVRLLQKHDIAFSTLSVVNRHNAAFASEIYRFLTEELGSRVIQLIPCVEPQTFPATAPGHWPAADLPRADDACAVHDFVTEESVTSQQWGAFLCAFFDSWHADGLGRVMVNLFESAVLQLLGYPALVCSSSEFCGNGLALEQDGSVYACDHYVYPQYRLGNIAEASLAALAASPAQQAFGQAKSNSLPGDCRRCAWLKLCWGECPRNRFLSTAGGEGGLNYLCHGQRQFFAHALPRLQKIAAVVAKLR